MERKQVVMTDEQALVFRMLQQDAAKLGEGHPAWDHAIAAGQCYLYSVLIQAGYDHEKFTVIEGRDNQLVFYPRYSQDELGSLQSDVSKAEATADTRAKKMKRQRPKNGVQMLNWDGKGSPCDCQKPQCGLCNGTMLNITKFQMS